MRKRIPKKPKLVATSHIPRDCVGELARNAMKFLATVKVKECEPKPKPNLKEYVRASEEKYRTISC